jgi:uncharacterized protein (TIGR03435 family)
MVPLLGHGQTDQKPPAFEVASVKPSPIIAGGWLRFLPGGRFSGARWVKSFIQTAYNVEDYQVVGGPEWIRTDWYDIEAKAESLSAGRDQIVIMLQSLLRDRFKLLLHREKRDFTIYNLIVDTDGGPKLRRLATGEASRCRRDNSAVCGIRTTSQLASWLRQIVGHPVFDKSSIDGTFDVLLDFDTYSIRGQTPPSDYDKPSVFTALREQLGLRLESAKAPVDVLVIDHVERPTPD